jgi:indolepyruvate ferredoxin oxidoreductase
MTIPISESTIALEQKFDIDQRVVQLTGTQALLRMLVEREHLDATAGLNTATFVSGYPGSPLGGFDSLLTRESKVLERAGIVFRPGLNEELAATAVMGSQIANGQADIQFDGVSGLWFGKTPGLDRALDAMKHANSVGTGSRGGALAVVGDDPGCKSSTIPNTSEYSFRGAQIPVLAPADVQEIIEFGLAGFALSRETGLWVGMKLVTDIADSGALVELPKKYEFRSSEDSGTVARSVRRCFPPDSVATEREIVLERLPAAQNFARINGLDRITLGTGGERIGLVASGKTFNDLRYAMEKLQTNGREIRPHRLLKIGLIWPIDPVTLREFSNGLDLLIVVEEKNAFVEEQIRTVLYDLPLRPRVIGKFSEDGTVLFNAHGELDVDLIARPLARLLTSDPVMAAVKTMPILAVKREAWFCSGCPHSRSTVVPSDAMVGGGIGCHTLALSMDRNVEYIAQMGGEGAAWIGISPFVKRSHIFQNVGDGTFFHSGSLAFRAAVAARSNITFKILRNGAISMTGGQRILGALDLPQLCGLLLSEGAVKVVVVAEELQAVGNLRLPPTVEVRAREKLESVQQELRQMKGVTVLIFEQKCAVEKRRERKKMSTLASKEIYVAKDICEACGDCGAKSNCISLGWKDTKHGKKIEIQPSSCNEDMACVDGECPSFFVLKNIRTKPRLNSRPSLMEPTVVDVSNKTWHGVFAGVGGTGVVTASAILNHAAWVESIENVSLDQTGMAQKGGAVVSHLIIGNGSLSRPARVGQGECDLLIAFDAVSAVTRNLATTVNPVRTKAIINNAYTPTAREIGRPDVSPPPQDWANLLGFKSSSDRDQVIGIDTSVVDIASSVSPSSINLFVLGIACQRGLLPVKPSSIIQSIKLNGILVNENLFAFMRGREWVQEEMSLASICKVHPVVASAPIREVIFTLNFPVLLEDEILMLANKITEYDGEERGLNFVMTVRRIVLISVATKYQDIALRLIRNLFCFRYLKDEYEVARLALDVRKQIERERGYTDFDLSIKVSPPWLRNRKQKWTIPEGIMIPLFRGLSSLRGLRHTPFDPFAWSAGSRKERAMSRWFEEFALRVTAVLSPDTSGQLDYLLKEISNIRGYGSVRAERIRTIVPAVEKTLQLIETEFKGVELAGNGELVVYG